MARQQIGSHLIILMVEILEMQPGKTPAVHIDKPSGLMEAPFI